MSKQDFKKSSKLVALMEIVKEIKGRGEKVVVFSQFIGMLNLIERCLQEENIKFRVLFFTSGWFLTFL